MFRRTWAGIATAVLTTTTLVACSSSGAVDENCEPAHELTTITDGILTVSTYSLPPYSDVLDRNESVDGTLFTVGGELVGVDGDILTGFAEQECLALEVHSSAAAAVLSTVQAGDADVAAGDWYRTTERAELFDLTDPIYADQLAIISPDGVADFERLQGKKVGTVVGYQYVADLRDYYADGLVLYNSPLTMFRALEDGDIDAAVDTVGVGGAFTEENDLRVEVAEPSEAVSASLEPGQSAFVLEKGGNEALLEALNTYIAELRASGDLARILEDNGLDAAAAEPGEPRLIEG